MGNNKLATVKENVLRNDAEKRAPDNLRIWSIADVTDPTHTREAKPFGKVITAIDSYYQIKRATAAFGPLGQGWGYDASLKIIDQCTPPLAMVELALWYVDPQTATEASCPPVFASNRLTDKDGKPDEECFKKATTDAVTKALSYLGFSADIFMGLYDDAKYMSEVKQRFAAERAGDAAKASLPPVIEEAIKLAKQMASGTTGSLPALETLFYSIFGNPKADPPIAPHADWVKLTKAQGEYFLLQFKLAKAALDPAEPGDRSDVAGT